LPSIYPTMKRFFPALAFLLLVSIVARAQNQFEITPDKNQPGGKIFKGILSREVLETDTSFKWYESNRKAYNPNADALTALKKYADSIQLVAFMGTWCEDSHFVIPRFFALLDAAGFPKNRVSLIGVDRDKKTLSHLSEALDVTKVPTILIMRNGKELGRVVEFGKYGMFDKEMGEIITNSFK
jgi:thiol-disulfide isomerase/thioredoxin